MGSFVAFLVFMIKFLFRNKLSPTWHYYIWLVVIIRLLIPYSLSSSYSVFNVVKIPYNDSILVNTTEDNSETNLNAMPNISNDSQIIEIANSPKINKYIPPNTSFTLWSLIWVCGAVISILYVFIAYCVYLRKIKLGEGTVDKSIMDILAHSKSIIGVSSNINLVRSSATRTPTLIGVIKPKIIIPIEIFKDLTNDEKNYVFMHELVHLKRKDIFLNWVITLQLCIHWFNPIVWLVFYKFKKDCEISCDAETLKHLSPSEYVKYGETLIKLIKSFTKDQLIPGTTAIINKSEIKRRIIMISNFKRKSLLWSIIAITITIAISCGTLTNSSSKAPNSKASASTETKTTPVAKPEVNQNTPSTVSTPTTNVTPASAQVPKATTPQANVPKAVTSKATPSKVESKSLLYTNSKYKFTLQIPATWKGKYVVSENISQPIVEKNDIEKTIVFSYKVDNKNLCQIFSIYVFKTPVTKEYIAKYSAGIGFYLKSIGGKTFVAQHSPQPDQILLDGKHDSDLETMKTMINVDFLKVIKTIKFN